MFCGHCRRDLSDGAMFCPHCGQDVVRTADADAAETTAWTAQPGPASPPLTLDDDSDGDDLAPPRRSRGTLIAISAAGIVVVAGIAIALASGGDSSGPSRPKAATGDEMSTGDVGATQTRPGEEEWWTPPKGKRTSVDALAYAFATVDESNLGDFFDKDLQPIYGAPSFFEDHEPRRLQRDEMSHALVILRNKLQLRAGFNTLFVRAGGSYSTDHEYQLYRAMQVREVISVDESKRMREPPEDAVFYLAELHRGHSYDMLIEGEYREMGAELGLQLQVGVSASVLHGSGKYKVTQQGLGLEPSTGDAIFAMTPDEVRRSYKRSGDPVPVKLVFRTIPGRRVKKQEIPTASVIVKETWTLDDGEKKPFRLEPGRYHVAAESSPNGLHLDFDTTVSCAPSLPRGNEYRKVDTKCTVARPTQLRISNYTGILRGPPERTSLYVAKLPE